ncbi:acid phosphatase [Tunturiibacter gelidoferens]|uniref:acid phosphatase n=1 Tax=Tunturiibacter gelidiferens TaxID=3069689 RepID=A0AAU7YYN0_9BACT
MKIKPFGTFLVALLCVTIATQSRGQNPTPAPAGVPASVATAPSTPSQTKSYGLISVPEIYPGILAGYLPQGALPNSLALVPPAPVPGTAIYALDEAVSRASLALQGSPRWQQATSDADLSFPHVAETFSCSIGIPITEAETPHLYMLLRRSFTDAALSTYAAKNHYNRSRPFAENNRPSCTPNDETSLRKDGSYPSGHTTIGWAWALILTEIAPEQTDAILARGRSFGDSRLVCNVHWQSDVNEGRMMGAGTVARLHADPAFRADLDAAKTEYDVARAKELKPSRDCAAEAAALATPLAFETKPVVH